MMGESTMLTEVEQSEYLDEIRKEVCARCVERLPGGPPCAPLGRVCGIPMHLPALVAAIQEVQSGGIEPYLQNLRQKVCGHCPQLCGSACPCPMDYLAVLLVEAVEAVDQRRRDLHV